MKQITSAAANKWIKSLEDEKAYYLSQESSSSVYVRGEHEQEEKPEYDYVQINSQIMKLDEKIRKIRHAVNVFNTTTVLPDLNLTIDEALVKMAQLNNRKAVLDEMRKRLPKERVNSFIAYNKSVIEYQYVNYDLELVKKDYQAISDEIMRIQLALDICNQTITFEVEEE